MAPVGDPPKHVLSFCQGAAQGSCDCGAGSVVATKGLRLSRGRFEHMF